MSYVAVNNKQDSIFKQLQDEIHRGEYGIPGEPFMTVRKMADEFGISLATAQKIVNRLKEEGVLISRHKRLRIVSRRQADSAKTPHRIALLVTNVDNPFFSRLINAAELSGRRRGLEVVSAGSDYNCEHERSQLAMLQTFGVDGFLIAPAHDEDSAGTLRNSPLPFVLIGRRVKEVDCDVVMVHDFEAGRIAAQHLITQGCRRFLYAGLSNFHTDLRRDGFIFELSQRGIVLPPEATLYLNETDDFKIPEAGQKIGVFCYHDLLALRIMRTARLNHLEIPRDIAVVGMDNLPIASEVYPSLSSIDYPVSQIVENAIDILLRRIKAENEFPPSVNHIAPRLVVRESTY